MGFNCSEARRNLPDDGVQNYTNYFVKLDILYPSFVQTTFKINYLLKIMVYI